jgi:cytochrome d ubiquinol oxidase subunit II
VHETTLVYLCALAALLGLTVYALLGGADFGGGVWDLLAGGPRKNQQRHAIAHAMSPVWEANHVWLIFVLVVLFTCFPRGYAALCVGLFIPLHLTLLGIILRGAAFVFRSHAAKGSRHQTPARFAKLVSPRAWGMVFGAASLISPLLLGASFGAVTSGVLRVDAAGVVWNTDGRIAWLTPYSVGCGLLALSTCAYLAAVYLVVETRGDLREDFRKRAIMAGTSTAALAGIVLWLADREALWFVRQLMSAPAWPLVVAGLILFVASAVAVFGRYYRMSCVFAAAEIAVLLAGWGVAHRQYLIYPDIPLINAAAPHATLRFVLLSLPVGLALLLPSLWMLFHVFKAKHA